MKTPEEIKNGLDCCLPRDEERCGKCPYVGMIGCYGERVDDALVYIQQLEAAQPKWISVEERLPGDPLDGVGEVVELLIDKGEAKEVLPGYYDHNEKDWVIYFGDFSGGYLRKCFSWWRVIKWRSMSEPPKEDV